jgi:hypothetical protein
VSVPSKSKSATQGVRWFMGEAVSIWIIYLN